MDVKKLAQMILDVHHTFAHRELGAAERLRNIDLTMATVIARDAIGREWTGRRVSPDVALFEALPIGTYKIDADFSGIVEPLRVANAEVVVQVAEGNITKVILPIAGRPLRFRHARPWLDGDPGSPVLSRIKPPRGGPANERQENHPSTII